MSRPASACVAVAWSLAAVLLLLFAPALTRVGVQGESVFFPARSPLLQAQRDLERLFLDDPTLNSAVVVLSQPGGVTLSDQAGRPRARGPRSRCSARTCSLPRRPAAPLAGPSWGPGRPLPPPCSSAARAPPALSRHPA